MPVQGDTDWPAYVALNSIGLRQTLKKILVVDDEESIQLLSPDLVILDINMPDMNGIEVLRQMKEINPKLPVILSTAYHEYKQDLGAWASDEYIVKSSDLGELKEAVRRYLSK
jgi:two-component SAPR family response regulator